MKKKVENLSEKYVNFDVKSGELFIRPNGMFACITAEKSEAKQIFLMDIKKKTLATISEA